MTLSLLGVGNLAYTPRLGRDDECGANLNLPGSVDHSLLGSVPRYGRSLSQSTGGCVM